MNFQIIPNSPTFGRKIGLDSTRNEEIEYMINEENQLLNAKLE